MLIIPCPWCGPRDQTEFRFGGEAVVLRPPRPDECSNEEWANYLYYRENLKGTQQERWLHAFGCRQWFVLQRDTVSHEIVTATAAGTTAPETGPGTE